MLPLPRGAVWQLLFLFCAALYINGVHSEGRVVCYYTNWSVYRPGTAKFNPQNINPYLCTHLIYAFGGFTKDNQMKPFDKYQDIEQGGYAKFTGLKTYNKQLKTMIAIGGWNEASSRFSPLVANPERRQKFIKNILKFLRQNHFDGIDLDWEYPAHREGGKARDRDNYAQFVQELRAEFERESEKTGRSRLLVTMAVPAGIEYIEKGYDIPKLNKYLDWFNVLTYDFHSSHESSVNHHAPLYSLEEESEYNYDAELNIDYSIKFYLNAGADRDKLVLGIPTYGRSYTLINEESTEIGAPAEAPGDQGDATREKGYLAYYEICQNVKEDPEWTVVQPNPNAMGPYAYRRNQWVGYDDEAIVRKKAQYVVDNRLGGIMFWAIDNDDFRGTCTGKPYPLIEAAKDAMLDALGLGINEVSKPSAPQKPSRSRSRENSSSTRNRITANEHKLTYAERKGSSKRTQSTQQTTRNRPQSTTTSAPTSIKLTEAEGSSLYIGGRTTTPPPPTTPDPGTDFKCEEEGFFQHPRDCKKYYWCLDSGPSGLGIVGHQFTCPSGLYFNPAADSCDFARNVPCKIKKSSSPSPFTAPATTTTTARPTSSYNRITAATARSTTFFRTTPRTTTTTTTEASEEDIEYEDEYENSPSPFAKPKGFDRDAEEDPKVIKELIELIRKVGGVEELEKHLLRKDDGTISIKENSSSSSSSLTPTTASSISKSLYEKVLSKPNALNSFRNRFTSTSSFRTTKTQENTETEDEELHDADNKSSGASAGFSKYSSVLRGNSRQGPQSQGLDKLSEFDGFLKEKKKYITINRNRATKNSNDEDEDEVSSQISTESHEEDEAEEEVGVAPARRPFSASTPAYSTIRRTRPPTTTEIVEKEQQEKEVNDRKSYSSLNRSRLREIATTESPEPTEVTAGSSRYKYLERSRPTRPTTESSTRVTDEKDAGDDHLSENQENTVHFMADIIENTRETQPEIITNTQKTYASIGRRTTKITTAIPETETTTSDKTRLITTTTAPPTTTTSTTETPLTTPLIILETTTPESITITTDIPIITTTNPTTKTVKVTLPNGKEIVESPTTKSNPSETSSDISLNINSFETDSSPTTPSISITESGLDTNKQESDSKLTLTTTESTLSSTISSIDDNDDKLAKTDDTEHEEKEEVILVSKKRNKTQYNTRTRATTTPPQTTTTTNTIIDTKPSPTNIKKPLGVRRQQILLNRSSQTNTVTTTTTDIPNPTTESVNNDFLGTVSSPRPFGFPKRRSRPITSASRITSTSTTINEEIVEPNEEILVTKQKSTKSNAAANSQTKKYQFQRRTTTTTTTKSPLEVEEINDATKEGAVKSQVNVNEVRASEKETSTNTPETTAPITTTESLSSSPATTLHRRIKVLKFKRPVASNVNKTYNTNTTSNLIANSATNFSASLTETQNIVRLSSVSEVVENSQLSKIQKQTESKTIEAQTETLLSNTLPTPKRFRKVIRKLVRPVNRTTETKSETEKEKSTVASTLTTLQKRPNATRIGFERSSKFVYSNRKDLNAEKNVEFNEEYKEEPTKIKKTELLANRGRKKFTFSTDITSTTRSPDAVNRNRFSKRIVASTTEISKTTEETDETDADDEDYEEEEEEDEEDYSSENEDSEPTTTSDPLSISYKPTVATTESTAGIQEETTISSDLKTFALNEDEIQITKEAAAIKLLNLQELHDKVKNEQTVQQQEKGILSNRFRISKISSENEDDSLTRLRNKVKQDLAKGNQEEGVLSSRFKATEIFNEKEQIEKDDILLQLRNKVKQELSKSNPVEGLLSDRFKTKGSEEIEFEKDDRLLKLRKKVKQDLSKGNQIEGVLNDRLKPKLDTDVEEKNDSLLKLRSKVKQDSVKSNQEEGVVSAKLKKLLETKNSTSTLSDKVETNENAATIRQHNLSKEDQGQDVITYRPKTLIGKKINSAEDLSTSTVEGDEENETTTEIKEVPGNGNIIESRKPFYRKPYLARTRLTDLPNSSQTHTEIITESTTFAPEIRPAFRRKLVAKRPYVPTKSPLSTLDITTIKTPNTEGNKKYIRRKFATLNPYNSTSRINDENYMRTTPEIDRFKIKYSDKSHNDESEDYEEYDDEDEDDEEDENIRANVVEKPVQPIKPVLTRPPGLFNRAQNVILQNSAAISQEQESHDNDEDEEDEDDEDDEDDDEDEEEEEEKIGNVQINNPTYSIKGNRISNEARPAFALTPTLRKPFTPSRVGNTPYRTTTVVPTSQSRKKGNRYGILSRSTGKPRIVNRPHGFSVSNLTSKPVANDFERTTVLIPTKPAPFINPNTRAYERKYTGPTTESSIDLNNDSNSLIEDLNIEALNARNKKIFDINSKKHTTLKPKVVIPLAKLNENTQDSQQQTNTEFENDEGYQSTTSTTINSNTNTQQSTTLENTIIGTQNTDDANLSKPNNLNEIFSQDGLTTTPPPSTTLLHIFTLSDDEQTTTQNPLNDGYHVVPRLIVERVKPKHKVVEINRIVEVNSKEEKLRRKSKANTIIPVEGSQTYKVESLPHVEQLGEISVVKYVHQVDGSDITIEGRSTVTDYTPTEQTPPWPQQPVRHTLPDGSEGGRYGKALLPEVIREAIETSTISLEGLFESARKGRVLNTVDDKAFSEQETSKQSVNNDDLMTTAVSSNNPVEATTKKTETSTDSFNILKSIAIDVAKINLEPNLKETETESLDLTPSAITTAASSYSTKAAIKTENSSPAPEILKVVESSTVASNADTKATTVAAALFPQYVRPIVPLLRPESNESSPLVISIANLDKVILSKASKMVNGIEVEEEEQQKSQTQQQQIENKIILNSQNEDPETLSTTQSTIPNEPKEQSFEIHDSNAAFSSPLASIAKVPLLNSLTHHIDNQVKSKKISSENPLDKIKQATQTELYTINEGSVGSTTSSTIDSKISEIVSFSSETTVVRRKQPHKAKSRRLKNKQTTVFTTIAPPSEY